MKVAFVTTPPSVRSGIGDYARHLLPYLREHCDVDVFVSSGHDEAAWGDQRARLLDDLRPREFDQILYQLGNERAHAFMPRVIRALGGTVVQHDWVLFDMAAAAWPALARGGAKGHALALREGGLQQTQTYLRTWLARRRQRLKPLGPSDTRGLEGTWLYGWYPPEASGRWTADCAAVRVPSDDVESIRVDLHVDGGRVVQLHEGGRSHARSDPGALELRPANGQRPELTFEVSGVVITDEQRERGDVRRMGCFVRSIEYRDSRGEHRLDLSSPCAVPAGPVELSSARFELPFNRSVVRFADAFVVHSRYVAERIRRERNAPTPLGILHHGAEVRWRTGDRREARRKLGLPEEWIDSCLVVSFGGVQPHKRIHKILHGLALARRSREDIRLVLAGTLQSGDFDPIGMARALGLEAAVRFTGFLPESQAWDWLHAGDFAINLRGPTTGGTSGGIFQAFSMGRPVIVSDAAEQRELPDAAVVRVPLGEGEVETMARELVALRDDAPRREALEAGVRRFVEEQCHWSKVARKYVEYMETFPRARASRRKWMLVRAGLQRSAL
jgi:glycosyltransferase involved in cell wall biosynthesis